MIAMRAGVGVAVLVGVLVGVGVAGKSDVGFKTKAAAINKHVAEPISTVMIAHTSLLFELLFVIPIVTPFFAQYTR